MRKLPVLDPLVKDLILNTDDETIDWIKERRKLEKMVSDGAPSNRELAINQIDSHCDGNKDFMILDYGCGSGILNLLLLLKGYRNVHGVDIVEKFNKKILKKLDYYDASFELVKGDDKLPYEDKSFDIITSSLVLEHVENIDHYYSEAARILKPGGVCFFHFPHRLKPYDSHSRCWFIHYFPSTIRRKLWDIFARQEGIVLDNYLYLRTVSSHKKYASKYFKVVQNRSSDRVKRPPPIKYKGSIIIRDLVSRLANHKIAGNFFAKFFTLFISTDLYLKK